jgi:hypothetical protein
MNSSGGLRGSPWRALAWRLFLNVLPVSDPPVDDWREIISSKREQYSQFKAELYPDFERVRGPADCYAEGHCSPPLYDKILVPGSHQPLSYSTTLTMRLSRAARPAPR